MPRAKFRLRIIIFLLILQNLRSKPILTGNNESTNPRCNLNSNCNAWSRCQLEYALSLFNSLFYEPCNKEEEKEEEELDSRDIRKEQVKSKIFRLTDFMDKINESYETSTTSINDNLETEKQKLINQLTEENDDYYEVIYDDVVSTTTTTNQQSVNFQELDSSFIIENFDPLKEIINEFENIEGSGFGDVTTTATQTIEASSFDPYEYDPTSYDYYAYNYDYYYLPPWVNQEDNSDEKANSFLRTFSENELEKILNSSTNQKISKSKNFLPNSRSEKEEDDADADDEKILDSVRFFVNNHQNTEEFYQKPKNKDEIDKSQIRENFKPLEEREQEKSFDNTFANLLNENREIFGYTQGRRFDIQNFDRSASQFMQNNNYGVFPFFGK